MEAEEKPTLAGVLDHYGIDYHVSRRNQMIRCPVHDDDKPSCSVDPDQGLWRCHSCGQGGDSLTLIEIREETDFNGARRYAAAQSLPTGSAQQVHADLSLGRYGRRPVAQRSGGDTGYVPAWRRRG